MSAVASLCTTAAQGLFTVLFPSDCRLCGVSLQNISRLPVCEPCLEAMKRMRVRVCSMCAERLQPMEITAGLSICGTCRMEEPPFTKALAYGSYETGLRDLIQLLKYERVRPAANVLGRMLGEAILSMSEKFGDQPPIVVPVPLHRNKLRQRGFNQSELIARAALKNFSIRGSERLVLNTDALVRERETQSQTGLTPEQRRANIRGAFRVIDRTQVQGRDILVVDDVFTTGTTVSECARVLRRAGAKRVLVATVARVLKAEVTAARMPRVEQEEEVAARAMAAHA